METLRAIIADDERLARVHLMQRLTKFPEITVIGEAQNAMEAQDLVEKERPDLLFLDIQMPGKTGFDLLETLDFMPTVIFTTAYDEYALKAFEVNALDYLLKPVNPNRLAATVERCIHEHRRRNEEKTNAYISDDDKASTLQTPLRNDERIFIREGERCWFVQVQEIRLFESEGSYTRLHAQNRSHLIFRSLNQLEERLDASTFFRASRQHIVNLAFVENIESDLNGGLLMRVAGHTIPVSRRRAKLLKDMKSL